MPISFEKIGQYLHYLSEVHGVQFCIKDFCGFVAINKQLDETLRPFLAHTNPFCMYMKSDQEHYHTCLTMIRRMYHKCGADARRSGAAGRISRSDLSPAPQRAAAFRRRGPLS